MFRCNIVVLLIMQFCSTQSTVSELYTSTTKMELAEEHFGKFTETLENYIQKEEMRIQSLRRSLQNLKDLQSRKREHETIGDAIRLYSFSHTFNTEWNKIEILLKSNESRAVESEIKDLRSKLPAQDDCNGLVLGFARLQIIYNLTAEQFAAGDVFGWKPNALSAVECYNIGCEMFRRNFFRLAIDWFTVTLSKLEPEVHCEVAVSRMVDGMPVKFSKNVIEENIKTVQEKITQYRGSFARIKTSYQARLKELNKTEINSEILSGLTQKIEDGKVEHVGAEFMRNHDFAKSQEMLCRDDTPFTLVSDDLPSSLAKCYYIVRLSQLQLIKYEVISRKPVFIIVHDILSNTELEKLKTESLSKIQRSCVHTSNASTTTSDTRSSQSYSLEDNVPDTRIYHRRLEAVVNRKLPVPTEKFKITNYGPGGSFELHVDYWQNDQAIQKFSISKTNRLITFLFYLSDVVGGATVFPKTGLKIVPEKGSLAAWINLHEDGHPDTNALHAGCPVITGSKWIMSRYLHVIGQDIGSLKNYLVDPLGSFGGITSIL